MKSLKSKIKKKINKRVNEIDLLLCIANKYNENVHNELDFLLIELCSELYNRVHEDIFPKTTQDDS